MLGAILGDMVGSPFEFDHNNYKHKDFPGTVKSYAQIRLQTLAENEVSRQ